MDKKRVVAVLVVLSIALAIAGLAAWFRPVVNVTVTREVVSFDGPLLLLFQDASLEDIQAAVEKSGQDVDDIRMGNWTFLTLSVDEKRYDVAEWLLQKGADPEGRGGPVTPLEACVYREDAAMAKLLIRYGANPNVEYAGGVMLRTIVEEKQNPELLETMYPTTQGDDAPQSIEVEPTGNSIR